jgi:hypothetical protein
VRVTFVVIVEPVWQQGQYGFGISENGVPILGRGMSS